MGSGRAKQSNSGGALDLLRSEAEQALIEHERGIAFFSR